jgi:4-diphosphocytidyl-2-C-methyl-D-erythritol kinase
LHELAARLGADVPVCLAGRPAVMRGLGERIEARGPAQDRSSLAAVLINPRLPLATTAVFGTLAAPAVARAPSAVPAFTDLAALLEHMRTAGNDLEAPASALLPVILEVKAALAAQPGCLHAAMSGSGPTCFGLFEHGASAARAAATLTARHPAWWVVATDLDLPA